MRYMQLYLDLLYFLSFFLFVFTYFGKASKLLNISLKIKSKTKIKLYKFQIQQLKPQQKLMSQLQEIVT